MHYRMYLAQEYDWHFSNMHRPGDGNQELQLWFRKAGEALHQMVKSKRWGTHMTWHYAPSFNNQGDRTFSSFNDSRWLENVTAQKAIELPHWDNSISILGVLIGSDGTSIKKRMGGRPLYVCIGNISRDQRAKPTAWRFLGWIPDIDITKMGGYSSPPSQIF